MEWMKALDEKFKPLFVKEGQETSASPPKKSEEDASKGPVFLTGEEGEAEDVQYVLDRMDATTVTRRKAMSKCLSEFKALQQCFKDGAKPTSFFKMPCQDEHETFWRCYKPLIEAQRGAGPSFGSLLDALDNDTTKGGKK